MESDAIRPPRLLPSILPPGPGERRRVLVVDDEPGICYMARRVLEPRFEVHDALSGEDALRLLETEAFHIAMVDVRLPGMSGLDLLTTLKTVSPSTDVIVMTGSAVDVDEALEAAIRRRAFFFLRKPFPMTLLETLAPRVAEKQELEEQLDRYTRTLEQNLEAARIFQRGLLPAFSWRGEQLRISAAYRPSEQLGGDFFDYWTLPSGGTGIVIADVMGHGPGAAMVTGIVKSQLRSLSAEILDPGSVLEALEEELERITLSRFLSAFLLFDRPDEGEFAWASAGHPPALLWTRAHPAGEPRLEPLVAAGFLLNTGLPRQPRATRTLRRTTGSRLLLYTDGYPEARNRAGAPFDSPAEPGAQAPAIASPPPPIPESAVPAVSASLDSTDPRLIDPRSLFVQAAVHALGAADPSAGIEILEKFLEAFAGEFPPADDRAAILIHLD